MMHTHGNNHEMENIDYDNQLWENTRQAAAEFAAITPSVFVYEPKTISQASVSIGDQQHVNVHQKKHIYMNNAAFLSSQQSSVQENQLLIPNKYNAQYDKGNKDRYITNSLPISDGGENHVKYIATNPNKQLVNTIKSTNSNEQLVNAIRSVLDGSNCEHPCSYPPFLFDNRSCAQNNDISEILSPTSNLQVGENRNTKLFRKNYDMALDLDKRGDKLNHDDSNTYANEDDDYDDYNDYNRQNMCGYNGEPVVHCEDVSDKAFEDKKLHNYSKKCNADYEASLGDITESELSRHCLSCKKNREEIDQLKTQMVENFQILKLKVMSTDELISEHHKNCADLENEKKLVKDLQSKLDGCYGETGALRIQLEKALQANEPLKKTVRRFEYEKSLKQQAVEDLTLKLEKAETEIGNLKKLTNSSRCMQDEFKKNLDDTEKENVKEKKKVIQQAKLIDKLGIALKASKVKQRDQNKALKKSLRDNDKLKSQAENVKLLKLSLNQRSKLLKNSCYLKDVSPGKASKTSLIGILSPSPSPPLTKIHQRKKVVRHNGKENGNDRSTKKEHFVDFLSPTDSSTASGNDTDEEKEELPSKPLVGLLPSHLFNIPTLLSPPLSPIPPSPIPDICRERENTKTKISIEKMEKCIASPSLNDSSNSCGASSLFGDVSQSDEDLDDLSLVHILDKLSQNKSKENDMCKGNTPLSPENLNENYICKDSIKEMHEDLVDESQNQEQGFNIPSQHINQQTNLDKFDSINSEVTLKNNENYTTLSLLTKAIKITASSSSHDKEEAILGEINESAEKYSSIENISDHQVICADDIYNLELETDPSHINTFNSNSKSENMSLKDSVSENGFILPAKVECTLPNIGEKLSSASEISEVGERETTLQPQVITLGLTPITLKTEENSSINCLKSNDSLLTNNNGQCFCEESKVYEKAVTSPLLSSIQQHCDANILLEVKPKSLNPKVEESFESADKNVKFLKSVEKAASRKRTSKGIGSCIDDNSISRNTRNAKYRKKRQNSQEIVNEGKQYACEKIELDKRNIFIKDDCIATTEEHLNSAIRSYDQGLIYIPADANMVEVANNVTFEGDINYKSLPIDISVNSETANTSLSTDRLSSNYVNRDMEKRDVIILKIPKSPSLSTIDPIDNKTITSQISVGETHSFETTNVSEIKESIPSISSHLKSQDLFSGSLSEKNDGLSTSSQNSNSLIPQKDIISGLQQDIYDSKLERNKEDLGEKIIDGIDSGEETSVRIDSFSVTDGSSYSINGVDNLDSNVPTFKSVAEQLISNSGEAVNIIPEVYSTCQSSRIQEGATSALDQLKDERNDSTRNQVAKSPADVIKDMVSQQEIRSQKNEIINEDIRQNISENKEYSKGTGCNSNSGKTGVLHSVGDDLSSCSNALDDLDSEVASFKLPLQYLIHLNTVESSNQNSEEVVLSTAEMCSQKDVKMSSCINRADRISHTVCSLPSPVVSRKLFTTNSCKCPAVSTSENSVVRSIPFRTRNVISRRHSMYSSSINTVSPFSVSRLRVERTRSLSPSLFSPLSPPLSPMPPSPRRSMLTPIISPLPTTPLPESVSPLPPSPKITSPPLIRGSALLLTDDPSVFVPKPVSHNTSSAVKALKFSKNDASKNYQNSSRREEALKSCRLMLQSKTSKSYSPYNSNKFIDIFKVSPNKSDKIVVTSNISYSPKYKHLFDNSKLSFSTNYQTIGNPVTFSSCNVHKAITKVSCYPYKLEEHIGKPNSSFSCNTGVDDVVHNLHFPHKYINPMAKRTELNSLKKNNEIDTKDKEKLYCTERFVELNAINKKACLKSMNNNEIKLKAKISSKSNFKLPDNDCSPKNINRCKEKYVRVELNSLVNKKNTALSYSSSTITKPIKQAESHLDCCTTLTVCPSAFYSKKNSLTNSENEKSITSYSIKENSRNVWRHFNEKQVEQQFTKNAIKKNINHDNVQLMSSDDNCLHVVTDDSASQEDNALTDNGDSLEGTIEQIRKVHDSECPSSSQEGKGSGDLKIDDEQNIKEGEEDCNVGEKRKFYAKLNLISHPKKQFIDYISTNKCGEDIIGTDENMVFSKDLVPCTSNINTNSTSDCMKMSEVTDMLVSDEEEGEIRESDNELAIDTKERGSNIRDSKNNLSVTGSMEEPISNTMKMNLFKESINLSSRHSLNMRHNMSDVGYTKKVFNDLKKKDISKKDIIILLSKKSNLLTIKSLSKALVYTVMECNETLLPNILKKLEKECTCTSDIANCSPLVELNRCSRCINDKCACKKDNQQLCQQCKELGLTSDYKDDSRQNINIVRQRDAFLKCHPFAGNICPPVLTVFEKDLLIVLIAVLKMRNFKNSLPILLEDLHSNILSDQIMLTCERLALCRVFAAICRLYHKVDRLTGLVFSVAHDQIPYLSYSMLFITCYSIWPSFLTRTDLILQNRETSELLLYKIKLSPLAAVLQFIAISESVERKESVSQKIMEKLLSIKWPSNISWFDYYKQFIDEMCLLLFNIELSFIKRYEDDRLEFCPFVFSSIKGIEILCKRMGWEWTYNKLISERIWNIIKKYVSGFDGIQADTVAIFIRLSGYLCQYGISTGCKDLQDYCQLLVNVLNKIIESDMVLDSIEISIVYSLLDMSPTYSEICQLTLENWLDQAKRRNFVVPTIVSAAVSHIIDTCRIS